MHEWQTQALKTPLGTCRRSRRWYRRVRELCRFSAPESEATSRVIALHHQMCRHARRQAHTARIINAQEINDAGARDRLIAGAFWGQKSHNHEA